MAREQRADTCPAGPAARVNLTVSVLPVRGPVKVVPSLLNVSTIGVKPKKEQSLVNHRPCMPA